jgi:hypothetical protein
MFLWCYVKGRVNPLFYMDLLQKIVFNQIQCYFIVNKLTDFQHTYREGHSTNTTVTQMTDDWLR